MIRPRLSPTFLPDPPGPREPVLEPDAMCEAILGELRKPGFDFFLSMETGLLP
jgi:hypothetical protein